MMDDNGLNHPADQLALIRQRIKALQEQEADLKAVCQKLPQSEWLGRYNAVNVAKVSRTALDTKALREALGEAALAPFMKTTEATVVTIKPMEG